MKAKKLPSGSYRCQAYADGQRKSFTAPTKKEAEFAAIQWQNSRKKALSSNTVGEIVDRYIDSKEHILSPSSIDGYRRSKKNYFSPIADIPVDKLTNETVQLFVNSLSASKSPKTVKNAYGLLISALNVYAPDLRIRCTVPKIQKQIKQLPEVGEIFDAIKGTDIELPCMLALWCGLRKSEILGIKVSEIRDNILIISSVVITVNREQIEKRCTKTVESTRQIALPEYIMNLINALPPNQDRVTLLTGNALYKRFSKLLEQKGIRHMTFHDLRHMNASVMLALGVPDKYAMERGGWSTPNVMKSVYQHTFSTERREVDRRIDNYFESLLHT